MSVETNKHIIQRLTTEIINAANESAAAELIPPDSVFHVPGMSIPLHSPEGYLQTLRWLRSGFSDIQWTLEDVVAEGDKVAARFSIHGTHDGPFFGVPPSGKAIVGISMSFYRIVDGKIVEGYSLPNMFDIFQQFGTYPSAPD
jgi:steroid delta-isomerase-like uncharacterized protein